VGDSFARARLRTVTSSLIAIEYKLLCERLFALAALRADAPAVDDMLDTPLFEAVLCSMDALLVCL
jgi:hypothetical protein